MTRTDPASDQSTYWQSHSEKVAEEMGQDVRAHDWISDGAFRRNQSFIVRLFDGRENLRILDVGCGNGLFTKPLCQSHELMGVDCSPGMARLARENGSTSIAASAVEIPFGAGTFDAVLCIEMLQCVPESDTAVREMARVLKPGGRLVIQTLNRSSWARKFHRLFNSDYEKLRMFSVTELRAFDQLAPLKIQELYFNFYPLPFCCPCDGFAWLAKPVATSLVLVAEKKA